MTAPHTWHTRVNSTHQKMTELRPRMCEMGAKKNGPAAIPAKAAEFCMVSVMFIPCIRA